MGLSESRVTAIIAVSDLETARSFYEGKLGLSDYEEQPDGGRTYSCAEGTRIHVYPSPDNAGKSTATVAGFTVDDVEGTVDELTGNGITFEQYPAPFPFPTNEKGIASMGGQSVAWMKDPDGNTLAIEDVQPG